MPSTHFKHDEHRAVALVFPSQHHKLNVFSILVFGFVADHSKLFSLFVFFGGT